jgi:transglutaminase-like putative cysteine protease
MRFFVTSSLYYCASGPSTLICSFCCAKTPGQVIKKETITTSRDLLRSNLRIGPLKNRFTRFEIEEGGELAVHYTAKVKTSFHTTKLKEIAAKDDATPVAKVIPYLFPSRYAPSDRLRAAAMDLFGKIRGRVNQVLAIEEWLFQNIYYTVGASTEVSCARDTLEVRAGVCRDFAHLGITFCRALCIPARYVTVYAYQLYPQDFHAVFEVYVGGQWYLIDGTRKAPLNGMVRIATGRDASDSAVATLFGSIHGQGFYVETALDEDEDETFVPIYRAALEKKRVMLALD